MLECCFPYSLVDVGLHANVTSLCFPFHTSLGLLAGPSVSHAHQYHGTSQDEKFSSLTFSCSRAEELAYAIFNHPNDTKNMFQSVTWSVEKELVT